MAEFRKPASNVLVVIAFAIVYLVWGSTYFFIRIAIQHIPALLMASLRFSIAGLLLLTWCAIKGEKLFSRESLKPAFISAIFLLVVGNGAVVWSEQYISSSFAAVIASTSPLWFVLLDGRNWQKNFSSKATVVGLIVGFVGVVMLFSENAIQAFSGTGNRLQMFSLIILAIGSASWAGGSLYSKYSTKGDSQLVTASWQMLFAGFTFVPLSGLSGEWRNFHLQDVTMNSWFALFYLVIFGSLIAFSAYTWLLKVRPATQVSTHAYVNPVVAVILGTMLASEKMSFLQVTGLIVVLTSVLLINLAKYRNTENNFFTRRPTIWKKRSLASVD
ncbi:MAG: EamA family transporter [Bacteroidetes bacterium]|nr:MAG: EamA family transporter [Bacteroidota bacterium]